MVHIFPPLAGSPGRFRALLASLALAVALGGCASVPPPDDSMNLAQNQLQAAREAGAADYAPVDLGFAQDKFQQAQAAMAARKYADAAALAGESEADAELARAKARLAAARAQMQSRLQENARLRALAEPADAATQQPAAATSAGAPMGDMPAPASSSVSASPAAGFQTVPGDGQPASSGSQGGQP
jgi:hypothetical protein